MEDPLVECPHCEDLVPDSQLADHIAAGCKSSVGTSIQSSGSALASETSKTPPTSGFFAKRKASYPEASTFAKSANGRDESSSSKRVKHNLSAALEAAKPLAERVRPKSLDEVVGQTHLLKKGAMLRTLIDRDCVGSIVLWGPPGTGKTTLARVIANHTQSSFKEISATHTSTQELKKTFEEATNLLRLTGKKTILFVDECQRLAKNIQELFLPHIEAGLITCLLATTENPSFRLQTALLSRCRVFVLEKLKAEECVQVLRRALSIYKAAQPTDQDDGGANDVDRDVDGRDMDDEMLMFLASAAEGDARVALSTLEMALKSGGSLSKEELKRSLLKAHMNYDRTGDMHYDTISALHKSIRGSDANAALYWLARMLEGGEDPLYMARRLVRMASEDVGSADPGALPLAQSAYQAAQLIGMPECDTILAQVVVHLAEAPKSTRVYAAYNSAKRLVASEPNYPVPLHIRNAPTRLMKELDYGKEYLYEPSFAHPVHQTFLPKELEGKGTFLQAEDSIEGKTVDLDRLQEWEKVHQKRWEGRENLELQLAVRDLEH